MTLNWCLAHSSLSSHDTSIYLLSPLVVSSLSIVFAVRCVCTQGLLTLLQGSILNRIAAKWARATVFFTFGFLAMKSR